MHEMGKKTQCAKGSVSAPHIKNTHKENGDRYKLGVTKTA